MTTIDIQQVIDTRHWAVDSLANLYNAFDPDEVDWGLQFQRKPPWQPCH